MNGVDSAAVKPSGKTIYEQRKIYGRTSAVLGEISQYNVEHLITFAVERKDGLLTIEDAVRKLKLLDARGKVWRQEALMQVDEKAIRLFDQNTQEELENFPLTSVQHAQTVLDVEPYLMVALVIKDMDQKNPDIHLFHSSVVPADVVISDIDSALADCKDKKGKKVRPETLRRVRERVEASVIPPPPLDPPPALPMKEDGVRERVAAWGNIGQALDLHTSASDGREDSTEVNIMKVNRDVQILNHTLDDIEEFISKLQKAAEALKELSTRRARKTGKSKKKMAGDGMLTLRSRLPLEPKFMECFRKFKFAFNLLAKLRTHIHNPNPVEIVHFLFAPLEMCVRACGGYDMPRSVESPLPTRDAIELITNCTTTHEAELWNNLGEYWTKSRMEFPKEHYFPPYVPQFNSGWEPPALVNSSSVEEDHTAELAATIAEQANRVYRAEEARRSSDVAEMNTAAFKRHVEQHVVRNQVANKATTVLATTASKTKLCRSMYDFAGRNKNELNVSRDELLEVLQDDKAWWRVQNTHGEIGYVPGNHMVLISSKSPPSSNSDGGLHTNGQTPPVSPLSTNPPQPIYSVPAVPPPPPIPVVQKVPEKKEAVMLSRNENNNAKPGSVASAKSLSSNPSSDKLQEELRQRVNTQKAQQRNFSIPKKSLSSDSLRLTNNSNSEEVEQWLRSKAFSVLTVSSLGVLSGAQIFTLTKEELKVVCDDEGARVFSQLQVQKSMMKESSAENELSQIMRKRQQMIEGD